MNDDELRDYRARLFASADQGAAALADADIGTMMRFIEATVELRDELEGAGMLRSSAAGVIASCAVQTVTVL